MKTKTKKKNDESTTRPPPADLGELEAQRRYIEKLKAERSSDLAAQRAFTDRLKTSGVRFGLVMEKAFANSIRALGYKNSMYALAELVDNSIQAGAERVHVVTHCDKGETVTAIAIYDDGHGMDPPMLQIAPLWGGTHRENDRTGFGRYGFGGPSACSSQGRRFTYYSAPEGGTLHAVTIDIDDIANGALTGPDGQVIAPEPVVATKQPLPAWLREHMESHGVKDLERYVGTIILIEKLDRTSHKTRAALTNHLIEGFGVTYRNYLRQVTLMVNGQRVDPVDPLFITPEFRGYALADDTDRAKPYDPIVIPVKGPDGEVQGQVRVRFSLMPPTFASVDKAKAIGSRNQNANYRWNIIKNYNKGLLVLRKGRQIDIIDSDCPWRTFVNYDRYWGCEIDFDPSLDEEYSVTTSKQQVRLSERMWDLLAKAGVKRVIEQLVGDFKKSNSTAEAERDTTDGVRPSEAAMAEAKKLQRLRPGGKTPEARAQAEEARKRDVKERAAKAMLPEAQVEDAIRQEEAARPYRIRREDLPGAPFFRAQQVGDQVVVYLNESHAFYTHIYAGPRSTPTTRAGLELLLFVIGDCMQDASTDAKTFYKNEVPEWSKRLETAIDKLAEAGDPGMDDLPAAEAS